MLAVSGLGAVLVLLAGACSSRSHAHSSSSAASSPSPSASSAPAASAVASHAVGVVTETFVDDSRATPAHLGIGALPNRTLMTTIWYPAEGTPGTAPVPGATADRPSGPYPLIVFGHGLGGTCLLYTSPSPRDGLLSRMPSSA